MNKSYSFNPKPRNRSIQSRQEGFSTGNQVLRNCWKGWGGGRNPEVGVLLGHEWTAGSRYGYRRHRCCLKRATSAFVPSACPSVVKEQDPAGKGFWELWSSGFFLWQRWAQRGWDGAECPETRVTPRWVTKQLLRNYLQHGPFFILAAPHACDILVLRPGIEPGPLAVRAQSPYYWTTREFPTWCHFY